MAYSRYISEIKDKDENIYGVMDKEARASLDKKYEKPSAGIPAEDIASGVIPDIPTWAKAAQKPSYTAAEVGATTTQEVNNLIASAIGDIHSFELEIVQELPTTNIKTHTIYLLPKTGETNDIYDEYAYINNSWEMIGNTQIDLSGYALKSELPSVPVQDVQVNGTSILQNGVANVPVATSNNLGTVKAKSYGIKVNDSGELYVSKAEINSEVKPGSVNYLPIVPSNQHASTFYGLAKAAGDTTQAQSDNAVGTYTDEAKTAIQAMLDVPTNDDVLIKTPTFGTPEVIVDTTMLSFHKDEDNDWYCTDENPIQGFTKAAFDYNSLYKIEWDGIEHEEFAAEYEQFGNSGWYEWTTIGNAEFLGFPNMYQTDAPFSIAYDFHRNSNEIQIFTNNTSETHTIKITKISFVKDPPNNILYENTFHNRQVVREGTGECSLVTAGAKDASNEYAFAEGAVTIASGKSSHAEGCCTTASGANSHAEGERTVASGGDSHTEGYSTMASGIMSHAEGRNTEAIGHYSHSEGFNTAASGLSSHVEGYYAKTRGLHSHAEGFLTEANGMISHAEGWSTIANGAACHVQGKNNAFDSYESLPEWVSGTKYTVGDKVKVTTTNNNVTTVTGYECKTANSDTTFTSSNWTSDPLLTYADIVGNGTSANDRSNAYALTWTGDGKYAGHVYVGTNADSSGGTMLPEDVQINGTSIVQNGVANIPYASKTKVGVIQAGNGMYIDPNNPHLLNVDLASSSQIKAHTGNASIRVSKQHESTFYGLALAAGADMASSDNAVGTYTDEAKAAIQSMLGIDLSSIASQVEIPLVETVSGAAVTITGQPNIRYMCGEVTSISITPPTAGSIDVVFTSGSTVAVLTLPSTVKMPEWFDASTLDTNTIYEILITDGVYGSVMTWAT